jgi:hypothetical protein
MMETVMVTFSGGIKNYGKLKGLVKGIYLFFWLVLKEKVLTRPMYAFFSLVLVGVWKSTRGRQYVDKGQHDKLLKCF